MTKAEIQNYIKTGAMPIKRKLLKAKGSKCNCGQLLNYYISPYITTERRVCPKCGAVNYVDDKPIDFRKVFDK